MRLQKLYLPLLLVVGMGPLARPSMASTILLDFTKLNWSMSTLDQSFDLQLYEPGKDVSYQLTQTAGNSQLNPIVAANFAAVERGLQINLTGLQNYEQLEIQADFHFANGVAYASVNTFGLYAVPSVSPSASPALQTYFPVGGMLPDPEVGSQLLHVDHFTFNFLTPPPPLPPSVGNLGPIITPTTPNLPAGPVIGDPFIPGLDAPEPGSMVTLGLGLLFITYLYRRSAARA